MILIITNHGFEYDMKNLCTVFFPYEKIKIRDKYPDNTDDNIIVETACDKDNVFVSASVYGKTEQKKAPCGGDAQTALSVLLYQVLSGILGFKPPWGILYGVRPAKLFHRMSKELGGDEYARKYFNDTFAVCEQKTALAMEVASHENKIIALSQSNSFSLYVSIPFCPTRCSYCSFVSHSVESAKGLIAPYVELLKKELAAIGQAARSLGLRLESIYFGGGTPTTLDANSLTSLFKAIEQNFDLSALREYTVEAGRPDTVSMDKLKALYSAGVSRISINPQSFNDDVLRAVGRRHTVRQTIEAFESARSVGFNNINMDFIAGLPEDNINSFINSINTAVNMGAESVTVHTLSLKSGAYMVTKDLTFNLKDRLTVSDMVDYSYKKLSGSGYYPYYMYRQSKSLGNLENVGWCKEGRDCIYNVFMMDETHTVLSAGAGAVTKLKDFKSGHIERVYNYKYPYEYINDFDETLNRKNRITEFYNEYI